VRNTKWLKNGKLRRAILSAFYNISQRNFGILLILWCSFKLWWTFCLDLSRSKFCSLGNRSIGRYTMSTHVKQVVTNLQQTCSNVVSTTCQQDLFALPFPSLMTSCQRLVEASGCVLNRLATSCSNYRPAIQQFVNKLWVTSDNLVATWQRVTNSNLIKKHPLSYAINLWYHKYHIFIHSI
jgi:hypothetical protein